MNGNMFGHSKFARLGAKSVQLKLFKEHFAVQCFFLLSVAIAAAFFVSGCSSNSSRYALAPPPEPIDMTSMDNEDQHAVYTKTSDTDITLAALESPVLSAKNAPPARAKACRVKDRFDKDAAIAYHWGRTQENRLSLDVDGIGMSGGGIDGVNVRYTMRLQPEKTKKERCRYDSQWQGMIGSGYNEMFLREHDTVWRELRDIRHDVENRFDAIFSY